MKKNILLSNFLSQSLVFVFALFFLSELDAQKKDVYTQTSNNYSDQQSFDSSDEVVIKTSDFGNAFKILQQQQAEQAVAEMINNCLIVCNYRHSGKIASFKPGKNTVSWLIDALPFFSDNIENCSESFSTQSSMALLAILKYLFVDTDLMLDLSDDAQIAALRKFIRNNLPVKSSSFVIAALSDDEFDKVVTDEYPNPPAAKIYKSSNDFSVSDLLSLLQDKLDNKAISSSKKSSGKVSQDMQADEGSDNVVIQKTANKKTTTARLDRKDSASVQGFMLSNAAVAERKDSQPRASLTEANLKQNQLVVYNPDQNSVQEYLENYTFPSQGSADEVIAIVDSEYSVTNSETSTGYRSSIFTKKYLQGIRSDDSVTDIVTTFFDVKDGRKTNQDSMKKLLSLVLVYIDDFAKKKTSYPKTISSPENKNTLKEFSRKKGPDTADMIANFNQDPDKFFKFVLSMLCDSGIFYENIKFTNFGSGQKNRAWQEIYLEILSIIKRAKLIDESSQKQLIDNNLKKLEETAKISAITFGTDHEMEDKIINDLLKRDFYNPAQLLILFNRIIDIADNLQVVFQNTQSLKLELTDKFRVICKLIDKVMERDDFVEKNEMLSTDYFLNFLRVVRYKISRAARLPEVSQDIKKQLQSLLGKYYKFLTDTENKIGFYAIDFDNPVLADISRLISNNSSARDSSIQNKKNVFSLGLSVFKDFLNSLSDDQIKDSGLRDAAAQILGQAKKRLSWSVGSRDWTDQYLYLQLKEVAQLMLDKNFLNNAVFKQNAGDFKTVKELVDEISKKRNMSAAVGDVQIQTIKNSFKRVYLNNSFFDGELPEVAQAPLQHQGALVLHNPSDSSLNLNQQTIEQNDQQPGTQNEVVPARTPSVSSRRLSRSNSVVSSDSVVSSIASD